MEQAIEAILLWSIRHHNSPLTPVRANGEVNPRGAGLNVSEPYGVVGSTRSASCYKQPGFE